MHRLSAPLLLLALGPLAACQDEAVPSETRTPPTAAAAPAPNAPAPNAPAPAAASASAASVPQRPAGPPGSVRGEVLLSGTVPAQPALDMAADPVCARAHAGRKKAGAKKGAQPWAGAQEVVAEGGRLANVLVRLTGAVPTDAPVPTEPVVMDQRGCLYLPRVVGARAGQTLQVRNSDGTLHNVRGLAGTRALFNRAQPAGHPPLSTTFADGTGLVTLRCDVHPWMRGYVMVVSHPYFATTGRDGAFELKDVPPGTYTLEAWHERFGARKAEVTVEPGKPAHVRFSYSTADRG